MRKPLKSDVRATVWDESGGICFHCGSALHPVRNFHVDHLIPVVAGGSNDPSNLVASCTRCNLSLGSKGYQRQHVPFAVDPLVTHTGPLVGLPPSEVAASLGVHANTVRRWIHSGLPALNVGTIKRPDYRIQPHVLQQWIKPVELMSNRNEVAA